MKNFFKSILVIALSLFCINNSSFASVSTQEEIQAEMDKIMELNNTDFNSFYNKSELVGTNRSSFNLSVSEYKLKNKATIDSLSKIIESIQQIEASPEFTDGEKTSKINDLIQKSNEELNNTGSSAINFLTGLGRFMPTITYSKFKKSFIEYYNDFYINENEIEL